MALVKPAEGEPLTEKLVSFRLAVITTILMGVMSGAFGSGMALMGYQASTRKEIADANRATVADVTAVRERVLQHYVTREVWLEWRRSEGEKRDRQYFDLRELILRQRR